MLSVSCACLSVVYVVLALDELRVDAVSYYVASMISRLLCEDTVTNQRYMCKMCGSVSLV